MFRGNEDVNTIELRHFETPIISRFVRIHPIKAQNADGPVKRLNARVSLIFCTEGKKYDAMTLATFTMLARKMASLNDVTEKTNWLIRHLIIIKLPECFLKSLGPSIQSLS